MYKAVNLVTAILIVCFGFTSHFASADEIRMKNGDVITGKIVKKEKTTVVFRTSYAGEINVQWGEVVSLKSDDPVHIVLTDGSNLRGPVREYEPGVATIELDKKKAADQEVAEKEFDLMDTRYINPTPDLSGEGVRWTGNINAGGALAQGNTENQSLRFDGETIARTLNNRFTVGGIFNRVEDRGRNTQFNSRGYGKYDHFFTPKWYSYVNTSHENDRFRDIRLRSIFGVGSGYQIIETPNRNLALEAGVNYVREDFYSAEDDNYPGVRWATKYDQTLFNGRAKLFHEHEALVGIQDTTNHMLFFSKTGFRFPLVFNLNASTQFNLNWDNSPAPGRKKTDTLLQFTLGYGW